MTDREQDDQEEREQAARRSEKTLEGISNDLERAIEQLKGREDKSDD